MTSPFDRSLRGNRRTCQAIPLITLCLVLVGCRPKNQLSFQSADGLHFTPPQGWVERMRGDIAPPNLGNKRVDVPLPAIETNGKSVRERLLVRYDRLTSSEHAWLRLSV